MNEQPDRNQSVTNAVLGHKKILYSSIAMIVVALGSIPLLCYIIPNLNPHSIARGTVKTIMLYGSLAALPFQLLVVVAAVSGIILYDTPGKYRILIVFGIISLIFAVGIAGSMLMYGLLLIPTMILLIIYLYGAWQNKKIAAQDFLNK
ncbi:MAG: hypothetical protein VB012_02910 [Erysipelotrichaceae bacterium]|nr:hypothetical protein [Erysipelotrichaceae bacterium]